MNAIGRRRRSTSRGAVFYVLTEGPSDLLYTNVFTELTRSDRQHGSGGTSDVPTILSSGRTSGERRPRLPEDGIPPHHHKITCSGNLSEAEVRHAPRPADKAKIVRIVRDGLVKATRAYEMKVSATNLYLIFLENILGFYTKS